MISLLIDNPYNHSDSSLREILSSSQNGICADPHDRVYAMQAIITPQDRTAIDYSIPYSTLVVQTVLHLITSTEESWAFTWAGTKNTWADIDSSTKVIAGLESLYRDSNISPDFAGEVYWAHLVALLPSCVKAFQRAQLPTRAKALRKSRSSNIRAIMNDLEKRTSLAFWNELLPRAVTQRQKSLAKMLRELAYLHLWPWRDISIVLCSDEDHPEMRTIFPTDLTLSQLKGKDARDIDDVYESAAAAHGFAVYRAQFLVHPEEWPLLDEQPSTVFSAQKRRPGIWRMLNRSK